MHKVLEINGKKYIFLPNSLLIFEYDKEIDELFKNSYKDNQMSATSQADKIIHNEIEMGKILEKTNKEALLESEKKHVGLQINIAHGCNMNCKYCFADGGDHGKVGKMSSETAKDVIDYIFKEDPNTTAKSIQIVGGEPLINPSILKEIVKNIQKYSQRNNTEVEITTTTNGTMFNDEIIDFFNKNKVSFMVSLDSMDKKTNDYLRSCSNKTISQYDNVMNNFNKYKEEVNFDIFHITVTPYNKNILETAEKFYDMGAFHLHFDLVKSQDKNFKFCKEDIEEIKNEYSKLADMLLDFMIRGKKISCHPLLTNLDRLYERKPIRRKCGSMYNLFAFDSFGNIYPCDMLMWDEYKLGNINGDYDLRKHKKLKLFLDDDLKCKKCWARYVCGGLCLSEKLIYNDNEQRELLCELKEHIAKLKIYIYDILKQKGLEKMIALK
ncbi:radical SAM protein [Clostridiaceae bacterium M8S5]|nr:radical SAM protein [Clostridiaceae bacterium M8S5]